MKIAVRVLEIDSSHEDGPACFVELKGDGWQERLTADEAKALLHALIDATCQAERGNGYIDG